MKFLAEINIMPRPELLDPQGKTVANNLGHLDIHGVEDVRIGKRIQVSIEADSEELARQQIDLACNKLLANTIMETYVFDLKEVV